MENDHSTMIREIKKMKKFKRQLTEFIWMKERFATMPDSEQTLLRVVNDRLKRTEDNLEFAENKMTEEILATLHEEMIEICFALPTIKAVWSLAPIMSRCIHRFLKFFLFFI